MKNWLYCTAAVLLTSALASALAQSPAAKPGAVTEPAQTTATYGDWVLGCTRSGEGAAATRNCVVVHAILQQGAQQPVAQIAIGSVNSGGPLMVTVVLPVAVSFAKVPQLAMTGPGSQVIKFVWRRCLPRGCFAEAPMTPDLTKIFRSSTESPQLTYQNAAERDVSLAISLSGLPLALDALTSEAAKR